MTNYTLILFVLTLLQLCDAKYFSFLERNVASTEYWLNQKLDHSDPANKYTWRQRYFVMDNWFNLTKTPVAIIYICPEAECHSMKPNNSFVSIMAQHLSGIVFSLEHRFYGKSQPFGYSDTSYSIENLKYLTSDQALNDMAWFIHYIKKSNMFGITFDTPWITVGGSYAGSLSAWFRSKFPHLTIGALASSAVINSINDFWAFDQQVSNSLAKNHGNCRELVHDLNVNMTLILKNSSPEEIKSIKSLFNSILLSDEDFLFYFSDITVMGVQYGDREQMCNKLMANQTLAEMLKTLSVYPLQFGASPDQYGSYYLRNTSYSHEKNPRQWSYQICNEFGWFFTPAKVYPMRSELLTMEYWADWCTRIFGKIFPDPDSTNNYFGGLDIQATNLIFVNGGEDPWQWASKTTSKDPGMQSYIADCDQCAHCQDLRAPKSTDSQILKDIRLKVVESFEKWIKEHYKNVHTNDKNI